MSDEIQIDKTIDVCGLFCPMPIVHLAKAIKKVEIGHVVEVLATDPGAIKDIPSWARQTGNEFLKQENDDKILKFYVKKTV